MAKKAIIILADGFEEIEAVVCIDLLRRAGIEVTVAGVDKLNIKASRCTNVTADKKLDDAGSDFDALVLPGGMPGATNLANSPKVKELIKALHSKGKIIAAICAAPSIVLAPLGILKGKRATSYPGMQEHFGSDTKYKEECVVADGNIITSRGPATAFDFALLIIEKLLGPDVRNKVGKAALYI